MQLTERCDIWRMVGRYDGGKSKQAVYGSVPCLRVPISEMDKITSALSAGTHASSPSEYFRARARESTALFLVPDWLGVFEDDELRHGRRTDVTGSVAAYRYTVAGIRDYSGVAYQTTKALFCERFQSGG